MSETFIPEFLGGEPLSETPAADAAAQPAEAPASAEATAAEPALAAAAEADGQARGPDGKFLPKDGEPKPEPVAEAAPAALAPVVAAPIPEPTVAPIAALLDERDKRQTAERERDAATARTRELEEWRQQQEAKANRQPIPDRATDPDGFDAYQRQQFSTALYDQKLEFSRTTAELRHGPEVVEKAFAWGTQRCDRDPHFNEKVRASRDPVGMVVGEWRRDQMLAQLGNDPTRVEAFIAWEAAQKTDPAAQAQAPAAAPATLTPPAAAPAAAPAAPRPSLASAPAAGSAAADTRIADGEEVFQGMFHR